MSVLTPEIILEISKKTIDNQGKPNVMYLHPRTISIAGLGSWLEWKFIKKTFYKESIDLWKALNK